MHAELQDKINAPTREQIAKDVELEQLRSERRLFIAAEEKATWAKQRQQEQQDAALARQLAEEQQDAALSCQLAEKQLPPILPDKPPRPPTDPVQPPKPKSDDQSELIKQLLNRIQALESVQKDQQSDAPAPTKTPMAYDIASSSDEEELSEVTFSSSLAERVRAGADLRSRLEYSTSHTGTIGQPVPGTPGVAEVTTTKSQTGTSGQPVPGAPGVAYVITIASDDKPKEADEIKVLPEYPKDVAAVAAFQRDVRYVVTAASIHPRQAFN